MLSNPPSAILWTKRICPQDYFLLDAGLPREGFDGLKPKRRSDRGQPRKLNRELEEHILALRKEARSLPASVFYDQLVEKGEILSKEVSYTTIYRLLKKQGMIGRDQAKSPERKRFSYDTVNTLWQGDMSGGPI